MSRRNSEIIDISVSLSNNLVTWPGSPPVSIEQTMSFDRGDDHNVSRISAGVHIGTHMDAPSHFVRDGAAIDQVPLDATIGPARLLDLTGRTVIERSDLEPHGIEAGQRVLLKTDNSSSDWSTKPFNHDFAHLSTEAAQFLASCNVRLVGIDYLSVSGINKNEHEVHQAILGAGIWVIEGLFLKDVKPGDYELICLPLKIEGSDGAPARAVLRPL